jgi:hypothetical protein
MPEAAKGKAKAEYLCRLAASRMFPAIGSLGQRETEAGRPLELRQRGKAA